MKFSFLEVFFAPCNKGLGRMAAGGDKHANAKENGKKSQTAAKISALSVSHNDKLFLLG